MAVPRLAPASSIPSAGMRAHPAARDAHKLLRRTSKMSRDIREISGTNQTSGEAETRSLKAVNKNPRNGDASRSRPKQRATSPQRANGHGPATTDSGRNLVLAEASEKSARAAPTPKRGAPVAINSWAHDAILAEVPKLRAFAISLCGNLDQADDFVQETLLRAWAHIDQFQRGTNMAAWLFTILRNSLRSNYRKYRREVEDADGAYAERMITHPEQNGRLEFEELRGALAQLPSDQRETLVLVVASGASYEEAAEICGCRVGTIKSRVHRARARLAQILDIDGVDDFAPDRTTQAVLRGAAG
jgi:RNA polymerase sigma-70 factor, ECF subfamily